MSNRRQTFGWRTLRASCTSRRKRSAEPSRRRVGEEQARRSSARVLRLMDLGHAAACSEPGCGSDRPPWCRWRRWVARRPTGAPALPAGLGLDRRRRRGCPRRWADRRLRRRHPRWGAGDRLRRRRGGRGRSLGNGGGPPADLPQRDRAGAGPERDQRHTERAIEAERQAAQRAGRRRARARPNARLTSVATIVRRQARSVPPAITRSCAVEGVMAPIDRPEIPTANGPSSQPSFLERRRAAPAREAARRGHHQVGGVLVLCFLVVLAPSLRRATTAAITPSS